MLTAASPLIQSFMRLTCLYAYAIFAGASEPNIKIVIETSDSPLAYPRQMRLNLNHGTKWSN